MTRNDAKDLLELSGNELNRKIRKLLRTPKSTWWSDEETVSFAELSPEEKGVYLNQGIALFPEVFQGDYRKFTPWLVYSCCVWCGNVRDIFSAGGDRYMEETGIYISAVMSRTLQNIDCIKGRILEMTEEEQRKFWGKSADNDQQRLHLWLSLVEENLKVSSKLIANNRKLEQYANCDDESVSESIKSIFMKHLMCECKTEMEEK